MTTATRVDCLAHFRDLASASIADPARPQPPDVGGLDLAVLINRPDGRVFRSRVCFLATGDVEVVGIDAGAELLSDCWLEGDLESWAAMDEDICRHGLASDRWRIDALVRIGGPIALHATGFRGLDRFHQWRPIVQAYFDGAGTRCRSSSTVAEEMTTTEMVTTSHIRTNPTSRY